MRPETQSPASPPWWRILLVGRNPKRTLLRIAVLVTVCFLVFRFVLLHIRVDGISMLPTYRTGRICLVSRLAYLFQEPRRGDVVVIRLPAGPHVLYLKRIVGLPGETVAFHRGRLVINGLLVEEPYVKRPCDWEMDPVLIRPGEYYVVGDNRSMARRDHEQGTPPRKRIMGKVFL